MPQGLKACLTVGAPPLALSGTADNTVNQALDGHLTNQYCGLRRYFRWLDA